MGVQERFEPEGPHQVPKIGVLRDHRRGKQLVGSRSSHQVILRVLRHPGGLVRQGEFARRGDVKASEQPQQGGFANPTRARQNGDVTTPGRHGDTTQQHVVGLGTVGIEELVEATTSPAMEVCGGNDVASRESRKSSKSQIFLRVPWSVNSTTWSRTPRHWSGW